MSEGIDEKLARLRSLLDGDERMANAASNYGPCWRAGDGVLYPSDEARHPGPHITGVFGGLEDQYVQHIARWDPAQALLLIAALRKLIDEFSYEGRETEAVLGIAIALYPDRKWRLG
jgi:hypothetical protein